MYIESVPNFIWSHTVPRMSVRAYLNMLQLPKKPSKDAEILLVPVFINLILSPSLALSPNALSPLTGITYDKTTHYVTHLLGALIP